MSNQFQDYWLNQENFILNNGLDVNSVGCKGSKINLATLNPYLKFFSTVGHRFEAVGMNKVRFRCELYFLLLRIQAGVVCTSKAFWGSTWRSKRIFASVSVPVLSVRSTSIEPRC